MNRKSADSGTTTWTEADTIKTNKVYSCTDRLDSQIRQIDQTDRLQSLIRQIDYTYKLDRQITKLD